MIEKIPLFKILKDIATDKKGSLSDEFSFDSSFNQWFILDSLAVHPLYTDIIHKNFVPLIGKITNKQMYKLLINKLPATKDKIL